GFELHRLHDLGHCRSLHLAAHLGLEEHAERQACVIRRQFQQEACLLRRAAGVKRGTMNSSVLDRTQEQSLDLRRRNPIWLILLFVLVGFSIAVLVSLLAGSKPYGVLVAATAILLAIPMTILVFQALPQGWAKLQILKQNWTWWHPLWFFIFFSMLVFRIRDVGAAKANPLDAWAMTRILPEVFVSLALIIRLLLKKPNWMRALFTGIPGAMAVYCLVCVASSAWS